MEKEFLNIDASYAHRGDFESGILFFKNNQLVRLHEMENIRHAALCTQVDRSKVTDFRLVETESKDFILFHLTRTIEMIDDRPKATSMSGELKIPQHLADQEKHIVQLILGNTPEGKITVEHIKPEDYLLDKADAQEVLDKWYDKEISIDEVLKRDNPEVDEDMLLEAADCFMENSDYKTIAEFLVKHNESDDDSNTAAIAHELESNEHMDTACQEDIVDILRKFTNIAFMKFYKENVE